MNIINNYNFAFSISLLLFHTEATGLAILTCGQCLPILKKSANNSLLDQTASCRILLFVTSDSYMLHYIRLLLIGPWLSFITGFDSVLCMEFLLHGKSLHLCTDCFGPTGHYEMK